MCGIIGFTGRREAAPILVTGLKRLEYRGYDSAGVAILDGSGLKTVKRAGKIAELVKGLEQEHPTGSGSRGPGSGPGCTSGRPGPSRSCG